jgi:hypothetical protein
MMMSGEQESKKPKIDELREEVEKLLQNYPAKVGLGVIQPTNEVNQFLTMTISEQRKLSAEECGEAAIVLNQAATYIQLETNRMQADIDWCTEYINWIIAQDVANVGTKYTPYEYRRILAIKQNDVAMKLQKVISRAQLRIKSLAYMPTQLRATAASFADLQQTKRSQRT